MNLGYEYRSDGMFLVRIVCDDCSELYDVPALAADTKRLCPACRQVEEWTREHNEHIAKLAFALRSRVLTDKEMQEVMELGGEGLFVQNMQPYFKEDVDREFNAALLQQFMLRQAAQSQKSAENPCGAPSHP